MSGIDASLVYFGINHGRGYVGVTKHLLDYLNTSSGQSLGCERMTHDVWCHSDTGFCFNLREDSLNVCRSRLPSTTVITYKPFAVVFSYIQISLYCDFCFCIDINCPIFVSFAKDNNFVILLVYIAEPNIAKLTNTAPSRIQGLNNAQVSFRMTSPADTLQFNLRQSFSRFPCVFDRPDV